MTMRTIKVPKPPKAAFNPKRKASDLLKKQIEHLEWAVRNAGHRKPAQLRRIKPVRTEEEAAARTEELMRRLPSASALPISAPQTPREEFKATPKPARRRRPRKKLVRGRTRRKVR
jgi:hypothetical protein